MNIKKIGLTALATTLVASSAYSADVSVSGSAGFSFVTQNGNTGSATDNGKGFGTDNALSFSSSGEMDNGWTVSAATAFTDAAALSSSSVSVTMGSFGTFKGGSGCCTHSGNYDGLAGAYEEVDDGAGTTLSSNLIGSQFDNGALAYAAPAIDAAGASIQLHLGYAPTGNDVALAGGVADGTGTFGSARFAGVTITHDSGLTLGIAGQEADRNGISSANVHDVFAGTWYATYAMGPVSIGYLQGYTDMGVTNAAAASASSQKTVAAADGIFESEEYVIAFNINDDLSVSYAKAEDTYDAQAGSTANSVAGSTVADVTVDHKSIQVAYSMGSMSIKAYRQETSNVGYDTDGGSHTKNEIALGLTF
jgi:outer membrane protein OmpU